MTAPDRERAESPAGSGKDSAPRRHHARLVRAFFLLTLCAVLYLALMPNYGRARFRIVPLPVYRWLVATWHDDFGNIVAFGVMATGAFLLGRHPADRGSDGIRAALVRWFASRTARLVGLLAMVCMFEILQIGIPGRTSSLQDVCTGWSGIFAAWLLSVLLGARAKNSGTRWKPRTSP